VGLLLFGAAAGCNRTPQATYPAKGIVKWSGGEPAVELAHARIELQVEEGVAIRVSPRGVINPDGTFILQTYGPEDGAPAGKYRAIILPYYPPVDQPVVVPSPIDKRWQSFQSSPLRITIEPTPNELEVVVDPIARP